MISMTVAKEIANRMEKLEKAEKCLKKASDIRCSHLVVEIYNEKPLQIDFDDDYSIVRKIVGEVAENHRSRLATLNAMALREAQSEETKIKEGKKNGRS